MWKMRERGRPPFGMTLVRVFPSTSSIVRNRRSSASSTEKIVTMWGWLRAASVWASLSNRSSRSGLRGQLRRQDLEGHLPLESRIAGAIDLSHPPGSKGLKDLVGAEACSRRKRHPSSVMLQGGDYRYSSSGVPI